MHCQLVWKHIIQKKVKDFSTIPLLPKLASRLLEQDFVPLTSEVVEEHPGSSGCKLVVKLQDGLLIETVLIDHRKENSMGEKVGHVTVCVSSQVGCKMGCTFCATGTMGLLANLTAAEILEQVFHAAQRYPVRNVVFMGMGEPMDNYEAVAQSLKGMNATYGFNLSWSHITVSTVGVVDAIRNLAHDCPGVNLALSLHAPTQEVRKQIVPSSSQYPIEVLMEALDYHYDLTKKMVMIEYIVIKGVNETVELAEALGELMNGRNVHINLIPYNTTEAGDRFDFRCPENKEILAFKSVLEKFKNHNNDPLPVFVRWSTTKGREVEGACGQLALKNITSSLETRQAKAIDRGRKKNRRAIQKAQDIEDLCSNSADKHNLNKRAEPGSELAGKHSSRKTGTTANSVEPAALGSSVNLRSKVHCHTSTLCSLAAVAIGVVVGLSINVWLS